jgi:hypothetical protein
VDSKILSKFFVVTLFLIISVSALLLMQTSSKADICHTIDGKIVTSTNDTPVSHNGGTDYDKDNCSREPLFYKVKFFEVMLCLTDPFVAGSGDKGANPDFSGCTGSIFSDAAGKDIIIEPGEATDLLDGGLELAIGTYPFAAIVVSNHLGIKHFESFVDANGDAETAIKGYNTAESTASAGNICWSVENKATTYTNTTAGTHNSLAYTVPSPDDFRTATMACGTTLGATHTYGYAYEIIDSIDDTCDASSDCSTTFRPYIIYEADATVLGEFASTLLQSDGITVGSNRANSVKLGYFLKFDSPLKVTEDTNSFEMKFTTSTSVSVDFHGNGDMQTSKVGADPFGVQFVLGNK